ISREKFAELREAFQALSRSEQDIFLMAQLKAMNGGKITASRRLKKKTRTNKRTFYCNTSLCQKTYLNMLGIGRTHFENVRNHLATNGIIPCSW
ncbi:4891_t:CDS:1, partial [Ambispora leptoticha]